MAPQRERATLREVLPPSLLAEVDALPSLLADAGVEVRVGRSVAWAASEVLRQTLPVYRLPRGYAEHLFASMLLDHLYEVAESDTTALRVVLLALGRGLERRGEGRRLPSIGGAQSRRGIALRRMVGRERAAAIRNPPRRAPSRARQGMHR